MSTPNQWSNCSHAYLLLCRSDRAHFGHFHIQPFACMRTHTHLFPLKSYSWQNIYLITEQIFFQVLFFYDMNPCETEPLSHLPKVKGGVFCFWSSLHSTTNALYSTFTRNQTCHHLTLGLKQSPCPLHLRMIINDSLSWKS